MSCLDERSLLALHFDDAPPADRDHVAGCRRCAARLDALRRDLSRIDTVLRTPPPSLRPHAPRAWRWAPLAIAATLALAVAVHRWTPVAAGSETAGPDEEAAGDRVDPA